MGIFSFLMFENSPVRDGKPDSKGPYKQGRPGIFPADLVCMGLTLVFSAVSGRKHPEVPCIPPPEPRPLLRS